MRRAAPCRNKFMSGLVFHRALKRIHLQRAAKQKDQTDFLWLHMADALRDRLLDIRRDIPDLVEIAPIPLIVTPDLQQQKKAQNWQYVAPLVSLQSDTAFIIDDEQWPLAPASADAIISIGHLHWVNDLPGALIQAKRSLRLDGVFMAALIGGDSLQELRACLQQAEMELCGGISARTAPMISLQDCAALLQRAQFALPVADHERVMLTYTTVADLVRDLRAMGQQNALLKNNPRILPKKFWPRVEQLLRENFPAENGRFKITVDCIYLLGWSPSPQQPQPLARGSATHALGDFLAHIQKN